MERLYPNRNKYERKSERKIFNEPVIPFNCNINLKQPSNNSVHRNINCISKAVRNFKWKMRAFDGRTFVSLFLGLHASNLIALMFLHFDYYLFFFMSIDFCFCLCFELVSFLCLSGIVETVNFITCAVKCLKHFVGKEICFVFIVFYTFK